MKDAENPVPNRKMRVYLISVITLLVIAIGANIAWHTIGTSYATWLTVATVILCFGLLNRQITKPNNGIVYLFGDVIGYVPPGIYVPFPGIMTIEEIVMIQQEVGFSDKNLITKEKTSICMGGTIWFQPNKKRLDLILELPLVEAKKKAEQAALTRLQQDVASQDILKMQQQKGKAITAIKRNVAAALGKGYIVSRVQLSDVDERIVTSAEEIRIRGKAQSDAAKGMSDALGSNAHEVQRAIEHGNAAVAVTKALADGGVRITEALRGKSSTSSKKSGEESDDTSLEKTLARIADGIDDLRGK